MTSGYGNRIESDHLCPDCAATLKTQDRASGNVMCHACNGLDRSAYFDWGRKRKRNQADRFKSTIEAARPYTRD